MLSAKEALVVSIVEAFDNAIAPRFTFRNEDNFRTDMETKADHQAKTPGIAIGTPEGQLIVELEISRDAQTLPLSPKP